MEPTASFHLWPPAISEHARQVDLLIWSYTGLLFVIIVPLFLLLVWFCLKYRRGRDADRTYPQDRSIGIESTWTALPFLLGLIFFVWAAELYADLFKPPPDALQINVVAKQWMWKVQHPGGQSEIDELHVPANRPVELNMISEDVIHDLFLPSLRLKRDVLPDRYTHIWFKADKPGEYKLMCAEFCGTEHSRMRGRFVVMKPDEYAAWLDSAARAQPLAQAGEALFRKLGCSGCHGANSVAHAPSFDGLYGSPVPLSDGTVIRADERYIRDSILMPKKDVVAGYAPIMPSFANQVTEEDLMKLIAYIKSLASPSPPSRP